MKGKLLCVFILAGLGLSGDSFSQTGQKTVAAQDRQVYSNHAVAIKSGLLSWRWELSQVIGVLYSGVTVDILASKEVGHGKFWKQIQYVDVSRQKAITGWIYCGNSPDGCP